LVELAVAQQHRMTYAAEPRRHQRLRSLGDDPRAEPAVSLDWFVTYGNDENELLLAAEELLIAHGPSEGPEQTGRLLVTHPGGLWAMTWRRDDGVAPVVISYRPVDH
jgi:hypothetical protein